MSITFALRPCHPFPNTLSSSIQALRKPSSLFSTSTLTLDPARPLHYGPSLYRGRPLAVPPPLPPPSSDDPIDRSIFARAFDVPALRVPAEECSALESRLRGHLLNWPRVRNIARVPGDDIDPEFKQIMCVSAGDGRRLDSLAPREDEDEAFSTVLYREKLAKDFNCRGFVNFRNLAKISRPRRKKGKEGEQEVIETKRKGRKNDFVVVEVVDDIDEGDDMRGLLGDDFSRGRWRGPTRLLLLDDQYAKKGVEELPEAVKVLVHDHDKQNRPKLYELMQCRLTLFYNYWQMNEILETMLPPGVVVPTGFETVGHIAHLNLRDEHLPYKKLIAQVVLDKNEPKIKTVVNKIDAIQDDYRTMQLEILAGNHSLVTTVIENGIRFQVDLGRVYWNSRLATERQRLISSFTSSDVVCDIFSGVGPTAISAARKVKHVYANDLNPSAVEYLERNVILNKLERKIENAVKDLFRITRNTFTFTRHICRRPHLWKSHKVFNMDGRRFIFSIFSSQRSYYTITQVVMNLPKDAAEFLDSFRGIFRKNPKENGRTLPRIHVYGFSKAEDPEFDFQERINLALCEAVDDVVMHRVRLVAPGKWMLCASFTLPPAVAFGKQ